MERPKTLFEEASYDLNKFRERRLADRRLQPRDTPDRRMMQSIAPPAQDSNSPKSLEH